MPLKNINNLKKVIDLYFIVVILFIVEYKVKDSVNLNIYCIFLMKITLQFITV